MENYKGRADQIHEVMEHVTAENYVDMSLRVRIWIRMILLLVAVILESLLRLFESDDSKWIEEINDCIE